MSETQAPRWAKAAFAALLLIAAILFVADPAYAHAEHIGQEQSQSDIQGPDQDHSEEWITGHCHGGPSCTGALVVSESIRPESIHPLSRVPFSFSGGTLAGMLVERDPPIPIQLL